MTIPASPTKLSLERDEGYHFMLPTVVCRIEQALRRVGDFGEVRLVVVKGRLKFIETTRSESIGEARED